MNGILLVYNLWNCTSVYHIRLTEQLSWDVKIFTQQIRKLKEYKAEENVPEPPDRCNFCL